MEKPGSVVRLTRQSLQHLKDSGFRFVLIKGYTTDKRVDYIALNYFMLIPVKELPKNPYEKEIYEPIDSEILMEWANSPDDGTKVVIEGAGTNHVSPEKWLYSDSMFNTLYPLSIQVLAKYHWTPLSIAFKVAKFLAGDGNVNVLDIGSGVGKFCLAAAFHTPNAMYYGVEQRKSLVDVAEATKKKLQLENVMFMHGNFTQLDFTKYDHFYFYNAFYENLDGTDKIDHTIEYSRELYDYYNRYLYRQLELKPKGTRICTLCSLENEMPQDFHVVQADINDLLKFWIKV